jgi:hypothetical protein
MNIKLSALRFTAPLFAMLLIGGLCGSAGAATAVSSCQTLSAPGNYFLTKNLTASGDCLVIAADNVAIDLKGHTITGNGSSSGINDDGLDRDYAIIANGTIRNFDTGINLHSSGSAIISNINASNNGSEGIFISECCNTLNSVTANNNIVGIEIDSDDSSLTNIQANGNSNGGVMISECCNTLVGSTVSNNTGIGVEMHFGDSFVVASKVQKNSDIGVELTNGDNGVIASSTSKNGGDGMELTSGDNLVVASKSNGNGGTGVDLGTNKWGIFSGVSANKNHADGVDMGCRGSTASLKAQNNSATNLVQTNVDGPCANVNLNAP